MEDWRDYPCKEWTGTKIEGYGVIYKDGWNQRVHRLAYAEIHGPIADGVKILHRCDNPSCYEERHLFAGTHTDNMRDMRDKGRGKNQRKTHCAHGHPYDAENTRVTIDKRNGYERRICRICEKAHIAKTREKWLARTPDERRKARAKAQHRDRAAV